MATTFPAAARSADTEAAIEVPSGVTAGVAVYDRQTARFTEQLEADRQFRSASVVKLLIVLDYLWDRGPDYSIPADDRTRLDTMLRSSDDSAASYYWGTGGGGAIVERMEGRLNLVNTAPPPQTTPNTWGYTAISAADTVRIYQYLLDRAPVPVRDYVMGNLRRYTRCATDGFDQQFGIAGAFDAPRAVKQGWSGFGARGDCGPTPASGTDANRMPRTASGSWAHDGSEVDTQRPALHTTGTVGTGDRFIVAVYTLHGLGTSYGKAYTDLGRITRSLNLPGIPRPEGSWFATWGTSVRIRTAPTTASAAISRLPAGVEVLVRCQARGDEVTVPPYTNDWWAFLPQYGGYITNIYFTSPDNKLPGVPDCLPLPSPHASAYQPRPGEDLTKP
ncbi:hypothetical protein QWJ26_39535 [Streptomyces sp. CSDS2]|uniref:hypothetical protein n=1 Tax=Streptomyces sp. CSDS2 TaxID=3055051 RepID=UPI0025B21E79|nr:hypothetical protein [Streptomyces sp. CSDS2]MDN3265786.1 hypothetical protein [Streptomyces sp. CSDS2]